MNDSKTIDEAQVRMSVESSSDQTPLQAYGHGLDHRRRRLIRGAVGIAPMIITLRSGALAASSCVNTKATVQTDSGGNITSYTTGSSATIQSGDNCIDPYFNTDNTGVCASPAIDSKYAQPSSTQKGTVSGSSPNFACTSAPSSNFVAIVSASVTSFAP